MAMETDQDILAMLEGWTPDMGDDFGNDMENMILCLAPPAADAVERHAAVARGADVPAPIGAAAGALPPAAWAAASGGGATTAATTAATAPPPPLRALSSISLSWLAPLATSDCDEGESRDAFDFAPAASTASAIVAAAAAANAAALPVDEPPSTPDEPADKLASAPPSRVAAPPMPVLSRKWGCGKAAQKRALPMPAPGDPERARAARAHRRAEIDRKRKAARAAKLDALRTGVAVKGAYADRKRIAATRERQGGRFAKSSKGEFVAVTDLAAVEAAAIVTASAWPMAPPASAYGI